MSLQALCSIHTVQVRSLTTVEDDLGSKYTTVGGILRNLRCRCIPITEQDRVLYMQRDMLATHKFAFAADPNVDNTKVLVYSGRVFRIENIHDAHELHRYFLVTAYHDPQVEVPV